VVSVKLIINFFRTVYSGVVYKMILKEPVLELSGHIQTYCSPFQDSVHIGVVYKMILKEPVLEPSGLSLSN
jgi:hypothetical protein